MFWVIIGLMVGSACLYLWWLAKIFWTSMWAKTTKFGKKALPQICYDKVLVYIWLSSMNPSRNKSEKFSFGHVSLELLKHKYNPKTRSYEYIRGCYSKNTYISFGPEDYPPRPENTLEELTPKTIENYRDDLIYEEGSPGLTFYFHSLEVNRMETRIKFIKESNIKYGLLGSITFGYQNDSRLKRLASWIRRIGILIAISINNWLLFIPIVNVFCFRVLPSSKVNSHSCVSVVFDVFHAGLGVSKLLDFSDELLTATFSSKEASKASSESSKEEEIQKCLSKVFRSFGYLTEASFAPIVISPDIFADFMKQAKCSEIKFYEIPDERKKFREENVEMEKGQNNFETEEWLPRDAEPKKLGRNFVLFAFPIIWVTAVAMLLRKILN